MIALGLSIDDAEEPAAPAAATTEETPALEEVGGSMEE